MPAMIVELGHFALVLAALVAIVQMIVPMIGASRQWSGWMAAAVPAVIESLRSCRRFRPPCVLVLCFFSVLTLPFTQRTDICAFLRR